MKGGPTDPPNLARLLALSDAFSASMKGGPTDPPNDALVITDGALTALQ